MKRILAFALIFTVLFTAMLGIMPSADTTEPAKLDIAQANVQFGSTVYLLVAVDYAAAGLSSGADVKVDVTNKAGETTTLTPDSTIFDSLKKGEQDKVPVNTYVLFKYAELSAKEMGDVLTIKAYVEGKDALTDSIKYSILEYAVKEKATNSGTARATAVEKMISFGAAAQVAFEYEGDYELTDGEYIEGKGYKLIDYGMVIVGGATDATRKTLAKVGETVTPAADTTVFAKHPATLYNLNFTAVNGSSVAVKEGISRYFYYGPDNYVDYNNETVYNNKKIYYSNVQPAGWRDYTQTPEEINNFVANLSSFDFTEHTGYLASDKGLYKTKGVISINYLSSKQNATGTAFYLMHVQNKFASIVAYDGALQYQAARPWAFRANNTENATIELNDYYLYINSASTSDYTNMYNRTSGNPTLLYADGKMTVSISIALPSDADYGNSKTRVYLSDTYSDKGKTAHIFALTADGVLSAGGQYVTTINKISVSDHEKVTESPKFTTVHFVIDKNAGTVTAYAPNGRQVSAAMYVGDKFTSLDDLTYFNFTSYDRMYVNRVTLSRGDLFN